uniref:Venom allergen-1 n=1 Tax=Anopheles epiroticus TaxID=199890 RepID=A0A182PWT7_9DIPT
MPGGVSTTTQSQLDSYPPNSYPPGFLLFLSAPVLLLFVLAPYSHQQSSDYCDADFCDPGLTNVGCNPPPAEGGPACSGKQAYSVKTNQLVQSLIVKEHNKLRSLLARGLVNNFSPAARMPQLVWDAELASQASHNVRSCIFGHDECHNTAQFRFAGQNIALYRYSGPLKSVEELILKEILAWWTEANATTQAELDRYPKQELLSPIGHFAQMINDRAWKVGCAAQQWTESKEYNVFYLVCNYSFSNMVGERIYLKGRPASRCATGDDKQMPGLSSFLLIGLIDGIVSIDYCTANLCSAGVPNVGCNPPPLSGGPQCFG